MKLLLFVLAAMAAELVMALAFIEIIIELFKSKDEEEDEEIGEA